MVYAFLSLRIKTMNYKLLQKLLFFMVLGLSLSSLQSCSEVEETIEDVPRIMAEYQAIVWWQPADTEM